MTQNCTITKISQEIDAILEHPPKKLTKSHARHILIPTINDIVQRDHLHERIPKKTVENAVFSLLTDMYYARVQNRKDLQSDHFYFQLEEQRLLAYRKTS